MSLSSILRALWRTMIFVLVVASALSWGSVPSLAQPPPPTGMPAALGWNGDQQGQFVVCLATSERGEVWVGTEDKGVWRYAPQTQRWTQFTTKDGLGDDNGYALAVDSANHVWVGHLNHGVSVWDGRHWQNYGLLDGPLGDRIFAIATRPGEVWVGTDAGVARYSIEQDKWSYLTRADGLPSDQIQAIGFESNGDAVLGTLADGIAIGQAADNYQTWQSVTAPGAMPRAARGKGLPSNLINDLLVARDGTIYVATNCGVGVSRDKGATWSHLRGADWEENVRGLGEAIPLLKTLPAEALAPDNPLAHSDVLAEDWITCIRQAPNGNLWLGTYRKGFEVRTPDTFERVLASVDDTANFGSLDYVRAVAFPPQSPPVIGYYDAEAGGLRTIARYSAAGNAPLQQPNVADAPLPSAALPPTVAELTALLQRVQKLQQPLQAGDGAYLGDDWRTWGDWVGRYGRQYAYLCGVGGILSHGLRNDIAYNSQTHIGPHHIGSGPYTYISTLKTDNPRVVYDPWLGVRRQAEENDGTWDGRYSFAWDGPDLWIMAQVPAGPHRISLNFFNKDAHTGDNKYRDYPLELRRYDEDITAALQQPPLARARVRDFWDGVYQQFLVCGPGKFWIRIGRNHSHATTLQAILIDKLSDDAPGTTTQPYMGFMHLPPDPPAVPPAGNDAPALTAARALWQQLDASYAKAGSAALQWPLRLLAYRAAVAANAPASLLANWRWHLPLWTPQEHQEFETTMATLYREQALRNPQSKAR